MFLRGFFPPFLPLCRSLVHRMINASHSQCASIPALIRDGVREVKSTHSSSEFQQAFPHLAKRSPESAVIDTFWQSLAINSHTAPQRLFMFEHLVKLPTSLGTMWEALKREKSKATTQRVLLLVNHALVYLTWRVSVRAQLSELFYSIIMP